MALHIFVKEMAGQKKFVAPLHIATKLRNPCSLHDRAIKKLFNFKPENRLDHKENITFPVIQNLTPNCNKFTGHYYFINLNLMAERFEVLDSSRAGDDTELVQDNAKIIRSIKYLWGTSYKESKVKIQKYSRVFIDVPKQTTTNNCGYFMLKFIEYWDGRKLTMKFEQGDMLNIRKLFTKRWVDWVKNTIPWQELLFHT